MLTASVFGASAFDIKWGDQHTYSKLPGNTLRAWAEGVESSIGTGSKFYVDSGVATGGDSSGSSWTNAVTTIDAAIGLCTASRGDYIYVAPGHAEAIASATGLVCDVAGVSIIGIGNGSLIPTLSLGTATSAKISVTAANVRLSNLKIISALADIAEGIDPTADADGLVVDNCIFTDGAVGLELVIAINVTADCDNITIVNNKFSTVAAGGCANAIVLAGGSDNSVIAGNTAYGTYSAGALLASAALSVNLTVTDNIFVTTAAVAAVTLKADTTGVYARNFAGSTTTILLTVINDDAMYCWENYDTGAPGASGVINPAIDGD
jgi:hypothetical protein